MAVPVLEAPVVTALYPLLLLLAAAAAEEVTVTVAVEEVAVRVAVTMVAATALFPPFLLPVFWAELCVIACSKLVTKSFLLSQ